MIENKDIDNGKGFDWGLASKDYAKYRDIYPSEFYEKIVELGYCTENQKVLDLGTGTGVLPRNMYRFKARWTGVDISENQIKYAEKLSKGMKIEYLVSSAENLNFDKETFDVITACQCFMYFDKSVVLPKISKWLKSDGHFLIMSMDWLPYESKIAKGSEDLVLKYNPSWSGAGMKRYELNTPSWSKKYFEVANSITYEVDLPFTRESWHGRIKACRGIGASSLSADEIKLWEKEHINYLKTVPDEFKILHYVSILDLKRR